VDRPFRPRLKPIPAAISATGSRRNLEVTVIGCGLAGALLALLLARRGHRVSVYERRADPRRAGAESGRSINLALATRGIRALTAAGIMERVQPLLIGMRGRMVHTGDDVAHPPQLQPYGQRAHEVIHSVSRARLNRLLIEAAAAQPGVTLHFDTACTDVDLARGTLTLRATGSDTVRETSLGPTFATDGAGSAVRQALGSAGRLSAHIDELEHDYKELLLPARAGGFALDPNALHIWPRRGFMLIALPNIDHSFTVTLFLPRHGAASFDNLRGTADIDAFFQREFPGAAALIPDLAAQFRSNPQGRLGTVHAAPWAAGPVLLLGDAAHGIVPFHGQGMNAAFEDCVLLDELLHDPRHADLPWPELFQRFEATRRPDTEAIATLSLENYAEMRSDVLDPKFVRQKALGLELERRFPQAFIPEYAMVMFHAEIPYAEALRRGRLQQRILEQLDTARLPDGAPDYGLAGRLLASAEALSR